MSPPRDDRTRDALKIGAVAVAAALLGGAGWLAEHPRALQSTPDHASSSEQRTPSPSAPIPPAEPLPAKKDVALRLLEGTSFFIHLDPRKPGVTVPPQFRAQADLVLQVGRDLAIPIPDLKIGDAGITATLSFNHTPSACVIPWSSVFALVGEDGHGITWPDDQPPEVAAEMKQAAEKKAAKRAP